MAKTSKLLIIPSIENVGEIIEKIKNPVKVTNGSFRKITFQFLEDEMVIMHDGIDLKNFSYVWLSSFWKSRDLAYGIKLYLDHHKVKHTFVEKSTSKVTDQVNFSINKLPCPRSMFVNIKKIPKYVKEIEKTCNYPLVIKDTKGSRGRYSIYITNRKDLLEKTPKLNKHRKYIIQEYIPNNYDWGVLIANGEIVSAEKSYPKYSEFRNNACNGASEVFTEIEDIPKAVKDIAYQSSQLLGLSWSRADIVIDKNTEKPYLLEVNRCPGITSESSEVYGAQTFLSSFLDSNSYESL